MWPFPREWIPPDTPSNAKHWSCWVKECSNLLCAISLRRIEIDPIVFRSARGAKPLEVIGTYNPIPKRPTNLYGENTDARPYKEIALDRSRAKYWLGVGAQPSDPVWKLMGMVSLTLGFFIRQSFGNRSIRGRWAAIVGHVLFSRSYGLVAITLLLYGLLLLTSELHYRLALLRPNLLPLTKLDPACLTP